MNKREQLLQLPSIVLFVWCSEDEIPLPHKQENDGSGGPVGMEPWTLTPIEVFFFQKNKKTN